MIVWKLIAHKSSNKNYNKHLNEHLPSIPLLTLLPWLHSIVTATAALKIVVDLKVLGKHGWNGSFNAKKYRYQQNNAKSSAIWLAKILNRKMWQRNTFHTVIKCAPDARNGMVVSQSHNLSPFTFSKLNSSYYVDYDSDIRERKDFQFNVMCWF